MKLAFVTGMTIVGVDFGAPKRARDQRRKIVAIAAEATGPHSYRVDGSGMNARLLARHPPGWSAQDLLDQLLASPTRVAAFDFPFSVPVSLLSDPWFAAAVGHADGAFETWQKLSRFVSERLPLTDPIDFSPFGAWRDRSLRARLWTRRATDVATNGQPPLKDKFQLTFQMTLVGNTVLSRLRESNKYRVLPFDSGSAGGEIIEVYPAATLRALGMPSYKSKPNEAMETVISACEREGIRLDIDSDLRALCCSYNSSGRSPDHDAADAFVALCTAILYAEGKCRPAMPPGPTEALAREGAIWVPATPL